MVGKIRRKPISLLAWWHQRQWWWALAAAVVSVSILSTRCHAFLLQQQQQQPRVFVSPRLQQPSPLPIITDISTTTTVGSCPPGRLLHQKPRCTSTLAPTKLFSLNRLLEQIVAEKDPQPLGSPKRQPPPRDPKQQQQTIFVGGKGGVGKTTVSAALAVHLAATHEDWKVLVVSTDPAHSLGDALDVDLKKPQPPQNTKQQQPRDHHRSPVCLTDALTGGRLYAQEVDAEAALAEFRDNLSSLSDVSKLAEALQVPRDLLESLGLSEFSGLLNNPPPGLDELVALSNVFDDGSSSYADHHTSFDVVVVDTAPTGHTLRLLALPQFLDGLLGKLIQLRLKLAGLASTLQSFLGSDQARQRKDVIDTAVTKLEQFKRKMARLSTNLQNEDTTRFVVVTVPTILSVAETKRLVTELARQSVAVTDIVVNQCVTVVGADNNHDDNNNNNNQNEEDTTVMRNYFHGRLVGQQKWMSQLTEAVEKVSRSVEYQQNGGSSIALTQVPFFDVELVGVPALGYLASQIYHHNPHFDHLISEEQRRTVDETAAAAPPKVVICGGKGGVGKTTTSASLAVAMTAYGGHKVALISTDPAHSLGDVVSMNLKGGSLQDCPLTGVPNNTGQGSLSVLEIDPTASLNQFKQVVDQLMGNDGTESSSDEISNRGIRDTLKDLQEVFDTLPAGTDEVVALAKIVNLVKKGGFDRIVLDTAPTGHTLRMLSTPGFLSDLIDRLLRISDKINSNNLVKMFIGGSARRDDIKAAVETAKSTLLSFQFQMYDLEDLFANAEQTEFLIVTVPTELAVRESMRLLNDLTFEAPEMPIKVRNVVINQVLKEDDENDARIFLSHVESTQRAAISDLETFAESLSNNSKSRPVITKVPYLDTEPRGVFGLNILAAELL